MPGSGGVGRPGARAAAFLIALILAAGRGAAAQGPAVVQVGEVRAVFWPGDERLATELADYAEHAGPWPGLPHVRPFPITLMVVRTTARFDSLTRGRLPAWTGAAAFPGSNTIVLRVSGDALRTLRHELAHLVLARVAPHAPLWFAEGYAVRTAEGFDASDVLALNWRLVRGRPPTFAELDRDLRGGPASARAAYQLAGSAVRYLERLGGQRGLEPLLSQLHEGGGFDRALRVTYQLTLEDLETAWHRDLSRRYGWLLLGTSVTFFWGVTAVLVGFVWWRRRRRDRLRRAALDEGWVTAPPDVPNA